MVRHLAATAAAVLAVLGLSPTGPAATPVSAPVSVPVSDAGTARTLADPARVLLVGDSVTQGYRGDITYRWFLWHGLRTAGDQVDFVGPRTGPFYLHPDGRFDWNYTGPEAYADPGFDQDHGAWFGGQIGSSDNWFYEPIGPQVQQQRPDVVVSMWGINDLARDDQGPEELIASYRSWIAEARAVDPGLDFVIGTLPYTWLYDGEVTEFNSQLSALAGELGTAESQVVVATMGETYTRDDSYDLVHPAPSGQAKIAGMLGGSLHGLLNGPGSWPAGQPLPVPAAPTVPGGNPVPDGLGPVTEQTSSRPSPPRHVRARRAPDGIVVTWRRAADVEAYRVRCGRWSATVRSRRAELRSQSRTCVVRSLASAGSSRWVRVRVRR